MQAVNITDDGVIEYYGNKAGYIKNDTAFVDVIFQKDELEQFLIDQGKISIAWREGIYDNLISGVEAKEASALKNCRIYQLKPTVDIRMKFISYDTLEKNGFGSPDIKNYNVVYDGNVGTNDLEEIYGVFNLDTKPEGYSGYSLSVSDIVELYDESESEFHYVDSVGFVRIETEQELVQENRNDEEIEEYESEVPLEIHQEDKHEDFETHEDVFEPEESVADSEENNDMEAETFTIIM